MKTKERDILKEFVEKHREELNENCLPDGHFERFAEKIPARKRIMPYAVAFASCVVVLLLVLFAVFQFNTTRNESGLVRVQAMEKVYIKQVETMANQIISIAEENDGFILEEFKSSLESLLQDPVPMYEQLPSELSPKEQTRIIKEYYNQKLEGLGQFKRLYASAE